MTEMSGDPAQSLTTTAELSSLSYMAEVGPTLVANGYRVLPIQPGTKMPGGYSNGTWHNLYEWQKRCDRDTSQYEVDIWSRWHGCAVGIAAGNVVGIDIDVMDAAVSHELTELAYQMLGRTPAVRIGKHPKVMLIYRAETPFSGRKMRPVEVLGRGQQFLAYATHPETGQPYTWPEDGLIHLDRATLPEITEAAALAYLKAAYAKVPAHLRPATLADTTQQSEWRGASDPRGTLEAVKSALAYIPNDDLEGASWVRMGNCLKAALGEDGRELWLDWSQSSNKSGASGKSDTAEKRWKSFRPRDVGAGTIYYLAEQRGWKPPDDVYLNEQKAERARDFAENIDPAQAMWDRQEAFLSEKNAPAARRDGNQRHLIENPARYRLDRIAKGSPPPQRFLLSGLMPLGTVGALIGRGGSGKSLTAMDLCLSVGERAVDPAALFIGGPLGKDIPSEGGGAAIFLTLEDDADEIHRRAASLDPKERRHGLPVYVIPGSELKDFEPTLVAARGTSAVLTEFAKLGLDDLIAKLSGDSGYPVKLLVLDPAGDFIDGDEDKALYVKPLMRHLRGVAQRHNCTILLLGHTSKSMDINNPSMRGSDAWVAGSRFVYAIRSPDNEKDAWFFKPAGNLKPNWRIGTLVKANHKGAPVGQLKLLELDRETGRFGDITPQSGKENEVAIIEALCKAVGEAASTEPFTITNNRGLFQRREELPACLSALSKRKLQELAERAIDNGRIIKNPKGSLVLPGQETEGMEPPADD